MLQVVILHYRVEKLQLEKKILPMNFQEVFYDVVESIGIREIKHRVYGKREIQVEKFSK